MTYYFAVFGSRAQTMKFFNILSSSGYKVKVINTPPQAHVSCSVSLQFLPSDFESIKLIISSYNYYSFEGFYRMDTDGYNVRVSRIFC